MREFLTGNWLIVLLGLMVLGYIVYLVVNRRWTRLREIAYKFIRQAEKAINGTKRGQDRFKLVLDQLYNLIPPWLQFFITRTFMEEKLQKWFNTIKDSLDDGKINGSAELPDLIIK